MFCPVCGAEYRSGATRCAGCELGLVHQPSEKLRVVWRGNSQSDCIHACQELRDAEIRYIADRAKPRRGSRVGVERQYEIKVPQGLFDQVQRLLTEMLTENPDEIFELPEDPRLTVQEDSTKRAYLRKLHPGDAFVEVLLKDRDDQSSVVELSFKTNLIRFRSEPQDDGSVKLFVLPEDESRAREIVREIREGKPPE